MCGIKIYAISVLSFVGSVCASDKASFKAENHALQCTTASPYNAFPSNLQGVGSVCGLGLVLVGIHSISLAARFRAAACSISLNQGLEKIQAAQERISAPFFALSLDWEKAFLVPSMARSTADAFDFICRLDHDSKLDEAPQIKKQKGLLREVLGPISRYRVADILLHMKLVSRASRPGQCTTAGPYHAISSNLLGVDSICGLGPDLVGIRSIILAAPYRVEACSTSLNQGLKKCKRLVGTIALPFSLSPVL